jgi:hypothetical protein
MSLHPRFIIIHHSATADGRTFSWSAIRRYHTQTKGWNDIGYHVGVELVNDGYEVMLGRMLDQEGAHCKEMGMNTNGIGVCLVGNYDDILPSEGGLAKLREVVRWLMSTYDIPSRNVLGHREIGLRAGYDWTKNQYKSCPGELFSMEQFRESL